MTTTIGTAYYRDREILGINERYVEGMGWLEEREYREASDGDASVWARIRFYNIQYRDPNGYEGQMDIEVDDYWANRTFVK